MTTTITPEQADTLPAEAIDLDALGELATRLRREATAFDNDLGSDPEADAGTARLLREAAGAIDLARRAAVPSEQEPVAWRSWAGAPGAVSVKRPDGVEAHTVVETIDTDGRCAISRADRVNWNIELSEDGVWVTHWRFAHPAPAAGVNEADWQPDALSALDTGEPK